MEIFNDKSGRAIALPFYIFLSLLLGYMGSAVRAGQHGWQVNAGLPFSRPCCL